MGMMSDQKVKFKMVGWGPKTVYYRVDSDTGKDIGTIKWDSSRIGYWYFPNDRTEYKSGDNKSIDDFIHNLMEARKRK